MGERTDRCGCHGRDSSLAGQYPVEHWNRNHRLHGAGTREIFLNPIFGFIAQAVSWVYDANL